LELAGLPAAMALTLREQQTDSESHDEKTDHERSEYERDTDQAVEVLVIPEALTNKRAADNHRDHGGDNL